MSGALIRFHPMKVHRMKTTFQFGGNAVLMRELRAALRSARPFALIALYVAVLGAMTLSVFPANQEISVDRAPGGQNAGKQLYWTFVGMQAFLVLLILPAIAAGAISQEREQRTLEPLILTPLTPLQIVWGKAVGVLSLAGLLLLSTLPLTSLCFLLGGVSPGELVAAYSILMGLAIFTTSIGLYCSAKWANTVKATLLCYAILPFMLAFVAIFSGFGVIFAALSLLAMACLGLERLWRVWGERPSKGSTLSRRLGLLWPILFWVLASIMVLTLISILLADRNAGSGMFGVFGVVYLVFIAQMALQQAAREIVRAPEPETPSRQKMQDLQNDWQHAMVTPYLPDASAVGMTDPSPLGSVAPVGYSTPRAKEKETYGVAPFLSDKLNPVFAKDMRSGLLGKFEYLARFSYMAVIASQLLLIFLAVALPAQSAATEWTWFAGWAKFHLMVLIAAGAWLGARSIAPEHEQQTLGQLVMTPLSSAQIVWGKVAAVMLYAAYLFMLGLPTTLLLASLGIVPWSRALSLILIEVFFAAFAGAWGLYCSIVMKTSRRALALSLGGVFCLLGASLLFNSLIVSGFKLIMERDLFSPLMAQFIGAVLSPLQLLDVVFARVAPKGSTLLVGLALPISLLLCGALTFLLLSLTSRRFRKYADTI